MGNKVAIVLAVLLGFGAIVLVQRYIDKREAEFKGEPVRITIAAKDFGRGQELSQSDLSYAVIPRKFWRGSSAVLWKDRGQLIGNKLAYNIPARSHMTLRMIQQKNIGQEGIHVETGLRAYTLPLGGGDAVANLLVLGDRIDILGTFLVREGARRLGGANEQERPSARTMFLMRDIEVKALDQITSGEVKQGYGMMTFELSPTECLVLEFAQNVGRLKVVKRNKRDRLRSYDPTRDKIEVTEATLMQFIKFATTKRAAIGAGDSPGGD